MTGILSSSSWLPGISQHLAVPDCSVGNPVISGLLIKQPGLPGLICFCQFSMNSPIITYFILINDIYIDPKLLLWTVLINCWISNVHMSLVLPMPLMFHLYLLPTHPQNLNLRPNTQHRYFVKSFFPFIVKGTVLKKIRKVANMV